jgi:hypothetical protein
MTTRQYNELQRQANVLNEAKINKQIREAAQCLLGISDEWGYFEVEQFLDWQLDNLDELPEGYPIQVMTRKYETRILNEVQKIALKNYYSNK